MTTQIAELEIDPDSGLPKLSNDYFWRVVKDGSYLRVEMVGLVAKERYVKAGWFRMELERYTEEYVVAHDWFSPSSLGTSRPSVKQLQQGILGTAKKIYRDWDAKRETTAAFREVIGTYPPKKL